MTLLRALENLGYVLTISSSYPCRLCNLGPASWLDCRDGHRRKWNPSIIMCPSCLHIEAPTGDALRAMIFLLYRFGDE